MAGSGCAGFAGSASSSLLSCMSCILLLPPLGLPSSPAAALLPLSSSFAAAVCRPFPRAPPAFALDVNAASARTLAGLAGDRGPPCAPWAGGLGAAAAVVAAFATVADVLRAVAAVESACVFAVALAPRISRKEFSLLGRHPSFLVVRFILLCKRDSHGVLRC